MSHRSNKAIWIAGGVVAALVLYSRSASAQTRAARAGVLNNGVRTSPTTKSGQGGTNWLQGLTQPNRNGDSVLGSLLKGLLGGNQNKPPASGGGGGLSAGAGAGAGSNAAVNRDLARNPGNMGTYVVNGQPYNANGQGLDENGRVMPGVWDNSGLGPAHAGINYDGTIASNPLEYTNGALVDVPVYLNNPAYENWLPSSEPMNADLLAGVHDQLDVLPSSDVVYFPSGDDGFGVEPMPISNVITEAPSSEPTYDFSEIYNDPSYNAPSNNGDFGFLPSTPIGDGLVLMPGGDLSGDVWSIPADNFPPEMGGMMELPAVDYVEPDYSYMGDSFSYNGAPDNWDDQYSWYQ